MFFVSGQVPWEEISWSSVRANLVEKLARRFVFTGILKIGRRWKLKEINVDRFSQHRVAFPSSRMVCGVHLQLCV